MSQQDVQVLLDLATELNKSATVLTDLQSTMSPTDPNNDVVSHLIGVLSQQSYTVQNAAVAEALALQGSALSSVRAATTYLKQQAAVIGDVNKGISIAGGLAGLAAAVIAHDPSGAISAASTLIGLIAGGKKSPSA